MNDAWAAGFIDGEGCFYAGVTSRGRTQARLQVGQNDRFALELLQELFGCGSIYVSRDTHVWTVGKGSDLQRVIERVLPYLVVKRRQAEAFLLLVDDIGHPGQQYDRERRLRLVEAV